MPSQGGRAPASSRHARSGRAAVPAVSTWRQTWSAPAGEVVADAPVDHVPLPAGDDRVHFAAERVRPFAT
ncbi:hypothetical protein B591_05454 [Streptomyces sp. GBA 94-10 4N24]|nr:hypothetical protein B591_05454 [Streptomyces sp. GBA 94-10 4N24]UZN58109.1 hypothetical protein B591N_05454 [Streptomyces sp. GBA 94-10 4N24]